MVKALEYDVRIIPTRVGTSRLLSHGILRFRDHPHACGDKFNDFKVCTGKRGSSPRVWGQVSRCSPFPYVSRIIPTRVGTRPFSNSKIPMPGSSPRVWGQVLDQQACYDSHGIIPTRVGTRLTDLIRFLLTEDHPHACGDKTIMKEKLLDLLGSSPRVWGQASIRTILMNFLRIIPTRVGTSNRKLFCG